MKSIPEIRRNNLNQLIKELGSQRECSDATDLAPAYISQMSLGTSNMGEKVARKIEKRLDLPEFWLDKNREIKTEGEREDGSLSIKEKQYLKLFKHLKQTHQEQASAFMQALLTIQNHEITSSKIELQLSDKEIELKKAKKA